MRVSVRIGGTDLLLHDSASARGAGTPFAPVSRSQALDLLARLTLTPSLLSDIRRSVGATEVPISRLSNPQLIQWLAGRMSRGLLWLDALKPLPALEATPAKKDEVEEEPPPAADPSKPWPPDPVVLPEYITAAWLESNEVRSARNYLCGKLDGLMYFGFDDSRPTSEVAPTYREAARQQAGEVRNAASDMNVTLTYQMYDPEILTRPLSTIAKTYVEAAKVQTVQIRESITQYAQELLKIAG